MKRTCPNCARPSIPVSELIVSDTVCGGCHSRIGVQWFFQAVFFVVTLLATIAVGLVVLIAEGIYAAILMVSLPIGAIGFVKARFCPLVVRAQDATVEQSTPRR